MSELLSQYTVEQIIVFFVALVFAVKEIMSVIQYFLGENNKIFNKKKKQESNEELLKAILEEIGPIQNKVNLLIESDKDDIRGWIIDKHRHYQKNKNENIDEFTMDCLEKRFSHYQEEGGNSYVEGLMQDLRNWSKEERNDSI